MILLGPLWTPEERTVLAASYVAGGYRAAVAALQHRSAASVMQRARRDELFRRRRWTPADDVQLRVAWSEGRPLSTIARELGRTPAATYARAQVLGLSLGCPPEFELLTAAAKRTGFCVDTLRSILERAGVPLRRSLSRPGRSRSGRRQHIVESVRVDEAVAAWMETEPVSRVAERVGVSGAWLTQLANRAGLSAAPKRRLRLSDQMAFSFHADRSLRLPKGGNQRRAA